MPSQCFRTLYHACLSALALVLLACSVAQAGTPDEERTQIRRQSSEVLTRLYEARPGTKAAIAGAAGYATFRNFGVKIGVAGTGKGRGLAVLNSSHQETFMRFVELQAGVGVGIKKYDLVFVFETEQAYQDFIAKGWQYSGQSTVAAKRKAKGKSFEDAAAVAPGVWLYQLTTSGLAAEVTLKSSKYFQDKELNY
jgi:lipid-binding SYLF domain-containing protein